MNIKLYLDKWLKCSILFNIATERNQRGLVSIVDTTTTKPIGELKYLKKKNKEIIGQVRYRVLKHIFPWLTPKLDKRRIINQFSNQAKEKPMYVITLTSNPG